MKLTTTNPLDLIRVGTPWLTAKSELVMLEERPTRHVFCILRLIYNHLADEFGIESEYPSRRYNEFRRVAHQWPREFAAYGAHVGELVLSRNDLDTREAAGAMTDALRAAAGSAPLKKARAA